MSVEDDHTLSSAFDNNHTSFLFKSTDICKEIRTFESENENYRWISLHSSYPDTSSPGATWSSW